MGYSIVFYDRETVIDAIKNDCSLETLGDEIDQSFETTLSSNFTRIEYKRYWDINLSDNTEDLLIRTNKALKELRNRGVEPVIPDGMDGWTRDLRVFAYHVKRFNDYAKTYRNHVIQNDAHGYHLTI
jgi:hypothetical protein